MYELQAQFPSKTPSEVTIHQRIEVVKCQIFARPLRKGAIDCRYLRCAFEGNGDSSSVSREDYRL